MQLVHDWRRQHLVHEWRRQQLVHDWRRQQLVHEWRRQKQADSVMQLVHEWRRQQLVHEWRRQKKTRHTLPRTGLVRKEPPRSQKGFTELLVTSRLPSRRFRRQGGGWRDKTDHVRTIKIFVVHEVRVRWITETRK